MDNGYIEYFDVRGDKPLWQIKAHEKEVTGKKNASSCFIKKVNLPYMYVYI